MNIDKYVFPQFASFLDKNRFNHIVRKYAGDDYDKGIDSVPAG
jgi:hypothetical protein